MTTFTYRRGQTAPPLQLAWYDGTGLPIDFADGSWELHGHLAPLRGGDVTPIEVTGIDGGVQVDWAAHAADLPEGTSYDVVLWAVETATGKRRDFNPPHPPRLRIAPQSRRVPAFIPGAP
jgi:hypothetical protein